MSTLSDALKQYYKLNDISVRKLAQDWGTSHATVSRFLNGQRIEVDTWLRIITKLTQ